MRIRLAAAGDRQEIAAVRAASWKAAYSQLVPESYLHWLSAPEGIAEWISRVSWTDNHHFVAELGGRIIGWASCGPSREPGGALASCLVGELYAIYFLPAFWHRGFGTRLRAEAENALASDQFGSIEAWAFAHNAAARGFYLKRGYTLDPTRSLELKISNRALAVARYHKILHLQLTPRDAWPPLCPVTPS
jgi:GNAT superfamily N-acetyltransferase